MKIEKGIPVPQTFRTSNELDKIIDVMNEGDSVWFSAGEMYQGNRMAQRMRYRGFSAATRKVAVNGEPGLRVWKLAPKNVRAA